MAGVSPYYRGHWRENPHVVFQAAIYGGVEVTVLWYQFDINNSLGVDRGTGVCSMQSKSHQTRHNVDEQ